jgi:hypothetical protein
MATQLLGAGIDPKVVAQRGGWSKVATMLDRYAHAIPANDRAAADVLGGMIAGDRENVMRMGEATVPQREQQVEH